MCIRDSYLGSLYSHLTVIVGQRLCATLGSHHHHHHYISSDVSSEQRRPWVHYNISVITKKISRMMSSLHRIWKDKRLSSTPNQITSLPSTGHISPSLGGRDLDSPSHQRKSLKCLWQILHVRWHQDFVTHQCFFYGCSGGEQGQTASQGVPHFPRRYAVLTFQMLQFNF